MLRVRNFWLAIKEPRHLKVAYFTLYVVALCTGIATLLTPPQTIAGVLGAPLTVAWSVFLITGGFGGILTVLPGWWWAERLSVALILGGLGIYAIVVIALHFESPGSRLTQLGMILLAAGLFIIRLLLTRRYSFEPRR